MSLINNVMFFYVSAGNNPAVKFEEKADPQLEWKNKEYTVQFLIPAAAYKELKKKEGKGVAQVMKPKKDFPMDVEAFKTKFNVDNVPKEYINGDDEVIMLQFSDSCFYKSDGSRNKSRLEIKGVDKSTRTLTITEDGEKIAVDDDTGIGNGSLGHIQWEARPYTFGKTKGVSAKPRKLFISKLVKRLESEDEFEGIDFDFGDDDDEFNGSTEVNESPDTDDSESWEDD